LKILIAIYPFLSNLFHYDYQFYNPWAHDPSAEEIENELANNQYDALIVGTKEVRKSISYKCPSLKVISRVGVGYNNIDVEHFKRHGVITTYTPFGPTDSTAEMALAFILAGTRRLRNYDSLMRQGIWRREFGLRLKDVTVGIVGFGRIGKRLATLLYAFGCTILLHDIKPDLATAHAMGWEFVGKEEILEKSDIISFHVPLKDNTRDWLSYDELQLLKHPVTLVNTARGGIVNEQAIYEYLKEQPDSYYCCDVFEDEPYKGNLIELGNTLLTPHASSFTEGSRRQTELLAIDNCIRVLRGEPCENIVERNE
jgi:D-3-phosphoglycerate dehydrogenase